MKYETLTDLMKAYGDGELSAGDVVYVDNDNVTLYLRKEDDEYGVDAECVYLFDGNPEYLLVEALRLLGISAEHI